MLMFFIGFISGIVCLAAALSIVAWSCFQPPKKAKPK